MRIQPDKNGSYDFITIEWVEKINAVLVSLGLEPFIVDGNVLYENDYHQWLGIGYDIKSQKEEESC